VHFFVAHHCDDSDLALLNVDMKNAFNECNRTSFLAKVLECFPEISAWMQWCYTQPAELRFGDQRILAAAGVQQGDPLGPLLFSLVVLDFVQSVNLHRSTCLSLWYLDDGTSIGPRLSLNSLLSTFSQDGPVVFGLHLNLAKCEIFWPSRDYTFPKYSTCIPWPLVKWVSFLEGLNCWVAHLGVV